MNFSYYKVQKALRQIADIAKTAERDCFPHREVLHPGDGKKCRALTFRVEMRMEDGSKTEYCLLMDPHNSHITRGKEGVDQSQFAPQFLAVTGIIRDISCRKYPASVVGNKGPEKE